MKVFAAVMVLSCIFQMQTPGTDARRLSATATVSATTSSTSLDLGYISGNLTGIEATPNATAASVAICQLADANTTSTVQTIATGFAAVLINGTHGNITGQALSMALSNTTNSTQQNVAQGYATAILAFYAANYTKVTMPEHCDTSASVSICLAEAVASDTSGRHMVLVMPCRRLQRLSELPLLWVKPASSKLPILLLSAHPTVAL